MTIAELMNQLLSAKPEKRRNRRLSLRLPMEYSFGESTSPRLAYTVDIGEGGLLIHVPERLEVGQSLKIKFYYHSASGIDNIQMHAEITRVDRLGKSGREYRCAVKFANLPSDILIKLQEFLRSLY